jgi:O-antigen ligase
MTIIKPELRNKIYYFLIIALSLVIPIYDKLVPPVIALICINWLLEIDFREKFRRIQNSIENKYLSAFGLLYILYMIGTLYSSELKGRSGAFFDLEVKLSLLLFPLLFATIDFTKIKTDLFKKVLYFFVLGCMMNSIFIFNNAVMQYFKTLQTSVFYYTNLSMIYHPSYLALYYSFATMIIMDWILRNKEFTFKKVIAVIMILHFLAFIVLLSSKAGILVIMIAISIIALYYLISDFKNAGRSSLICVSFIIVIFIMLVIFPRSTDRFEAAGKAITDNSIPTGQKSDGTSARIEIWKVSLQIIKENLLFGAGTGDVKKELLEKYKINHIDPALDSRLNAHNQYLQTSIAIGITGFLFLIVSLVFPGIYALRRKQIIYLMFLTLFAFHILVESMLERQAGVVFYAFFNSFLFLSLKQENRNSNHQLPPV